MRKLLFLLCCGAICLAQPGPPGPDLSIDGGARARVIEKLLEALEKGYVFPETAEKMNQSIRARLAAKEYDSISSAREFAKILTSDLQEVSKDKHLRVNYHPEKIPERGPGGPPPPEERQRMRVQMSRDNFGFEKVERLRGNVGYLDLRGFLPAEFSAETAAAAMNFLAYTDALIIDLRQNGGGDPATVAFLSSYLFDDTVHLNDLYFRPANSTRQWWTLPHVPGHRYGKDKPVWVLISNRTFSAAEEFSYNLQNLKRATLVGETTRGGAHPGGMARLDDHFGAFLPSGRAINPISKTNWEGTGVSPDIRTPADQALKTAHLEALRRILERETDERRKPAMREHIAALEK